MSWSYARGWKVGTQARVESVWRCRGVEKPTPTRLEDALAMGGQKGEIRKAGATEETTSSTTTTGYLGRDSSTPTCWRQASFPPAFFRQRSAEKNVGRGKSTAARCSLFRGFLPFSIANAFHPRVRGLER